MISQWKACLTSHAAQWGLPESGDWRFMLYNNYHPHCSDIDLFWFHNGGAFPRAVVKLSNEPGRGEREFENLKQAHALAPEWVPRPLHFGADGKFWALWMEGVPGAPFRGEVTSDVLRSMAGVVSGMHRAFRKTGGESPEDRWRRIVAEPLKTLETFGASQVVRSGVRRVREQASMEWLARIPEIPQHGDLYAGNLLTDGGRWHVIDWESLGATNLPAYDLYTLLLSLLRADGDGPAKWNATLAREIPAVVQGYAKNFGLTPGDMAILLPLTLASWFELQWRDGRSQFCDGLYRTITEYCKDEASWGRVFFPA
jgi:Ser/Thr protein kinase RdoA (MazF antagonist)